MQHFKQQIPLQNNLINNDGSLITSIKQATDIVKGLTTTEKMPSLSISLPAKDCKKGAILRKIKNSVCSDCYALKGNYTRYPAIVKAQEKRLIAINNPMWVNAMIYLLKHKKTIIDSGVFRWHDSGDIQNIEHLAKIIQVAKNTPKIKHWLPTKESRFIRELKDFIPNNLVVRLSGSMIDGNAPKFDNTSTVTTNKDNATCRSFENGGKCKDCRMCWNSSIKNISYFKH